MTLSISNIIWEKGADSFESFLQTLIRNDIHSVELSLNSIFTEPKTLTDSELNWLSSLLDSYRISVSALHSLTFTRPDLEIFGTSEKKQELIDYILMYDEIASALKSKNLVFGSAQARKLHNRSKEEADHIFLDFLHQLDMRLNHSLFHIEPLPSKQCEYLHTFLEGVSLLDVLEPQKIFIQLDIKSIIENQENINDIFHHHRYLKHIHTSEPGFQAPSETHSPFYAELRGLLSTMHYSGYISGEILTPHGTDMFEYTAYSISQLRKYHA